MRSISFCSSSSMVDVAKEFDASVKDVSYRDLPHPGAQARRRPPLRPAGRSLWPPPGADGRRAALCHVRLPHGLCAQSYRLPHHSRAVRHRHGRGMGRRRLAHHGVDSGKIARPGLGPAAGGLSQRACCWPRPSMRCSINISAGAACSWSASCPRCWCSTSAASSRNRRAWHAGPARHSNIFSVLKHPLAAGALRHALHDVHELLQPWHAGPLSHLPEGGSRARSAVDRHHQHHRRDRRDPGRAQLRRAVAAHRPQAGADPGRAAGTSHHSALGVFQRR